MALDIFKDLLTGLSDDAALDAVIAKIEKLNSAIEIMANNARKSSAIYTDALLEISQATDKVEKSLVDLDATQKKDQDAIVKAAKETDKLTAENEQYTKSLKDIEKEILILVDAQKKLSESSEKLRKQNEAEAGSITDLKKQLTDATKAYQSMGDATSSAVKEEALTRIKELSTAVNKADDAVKLAKKGVDAAKGSYNELSARVNQARKDLKAMEGGIGNNTKEFKALQAQVDRDSKALKDFDAAVDQNQRNVGNYPEAFAGLDQAVGGSIGQIQQMGKSLLALAANPVVLFLATLVAAFSALKSAVTEFWDSTLEGEEAASKQTAAWDAFFITLSRGWQGVGKAVSDFFGEDGIKGALTAFIAVYLPSLSGVFAQTVSKTEEFNALTRQLFKEHIRDLVDDAGVELRVNKLLEESKDKLAFSDQQRLEAIREARKEIAAQLQGDVDLAQKDLKAQELYIQSLGGRIIKEKLLSEYTDEELLALKAKGEDIQKLADLQAGLIKIQSDASAKNRALYKVEQGITMEITKAAIDAANREIDTARQVELFRIQARKEANDQILKDDRTTTEERDAAYLSNSLAQVEALRIQKAQELDIVKRAAEERARASVPTKDVGEAVANDSALANQIDLINQKYEELIQKNNEATNELRVNNVFKVIAADAALAQNEIAAITDRDLIALDDQLKNKLISLQKYEKEKQKITEAGQRIVLRSQLENLKEQLRNTENSAAEDSKIKKGIADLELALSKSTTAEVIKDEQMKQAAKQQIGQAAIQLQTEIFNFIRAGNQAETDEAIARSEASIELLNQETARRLQIVGDDAQAKAAIEADAAAKQKALQAQINAEKRKAAIADKQISTVQAIIQTALGVSRALASTAPPFNFILAAIVGAAGALQIAAIQKQTIPAFAKGTDSSPEGWALVGEAGREIVRDSKTNKPKMYDVPTVTYLNKGSEVINNKRTEEIMAMGDITAVNNNSSRELEEMIQLQKLELHTDGIIAAYEDGADRIIDAVRYSQGQHVFDERGYSYYERNKAGRVLSLNKRYTAR